MTQTRKISNIQDNEKLPIYGCSMLWIHVELTLRIRELVPVNMYKLKLGILFVHLKDKLDNKPIFA